MAEELDQVVVTPDAASVSELAPESEPVKPEPAQTKIPILAKSADGVIHQFPADTSQDIVDQAMKSYAEEHANKTTTVGQIGTGFMDPVEGGGQLISEIMPKPVRETLDTFNNWAAKYSGGLIRELPAGGKSEQIQKREHEIEQQRGMDKDNVDWSRMTGAVLNPINYIGGGFIGGASKIANLARAVSGGVAAGAISPAADPNYWSEKTKQVSLGGMFGLGIGAATAGASKGLERVGEWMLRKHPEWLENEAVRKIVKRMAQDNKAGGPGATDMLEMVNAGSKPITLADVGGENIKGLAGNVARQPGESRAIAFNLLSKRDNEAARRISADIDNHIHGGQTAHETTEVLLGARSSASTPAYEAMHQVQGVWSPRLQQFLDDPALKSGLARGYELERMISLAENRPLSTKQLGVDLDVEGNIKMLGAPNMRLLDMAKRGLDAMIGDERNAITGRLSTRGKALNDVRNAYIKELDSLDTSGLYKKARDTWAGYSSSMDAIKLGRAVFGMRPEEVSAAVERMSPANREFGRVGVADILKERIAKVGLHGDEAKAIIKNPWMRDLLRPWFRNHEDFEKFVQAVTDETRMFETGVKIVGKSPSAERVAEDIGGHGVERALEGGRVVSELARGHPLRAAVNAWRLYRDLGIKPNPELNEKVAQILFSTDISPQVAGKLTGEISSEIANPMAGAARAISAGSPAAGAAAGPEQTKTK